MNKIIENEMTLAPSQRSLFSRLLNVTEITVIVPFLIIMLTGMLASPNFFTRNNWFGILRSASYIGIIAIPVTFLLSAKGLDLSNGTVVGLSTVIFAKMIVDYNVPVMVALLIALVVAFAIGTVNGLLSINLGIPAFVVTLAMQFIVRGSSYVICQGYNISGLPESVKAIGSYQIFNFITVEMISFVVIAVIADFILRRTVLGRQLLLIGTNDKAAYLSGIKVNKLRRSTFIASSVFAAFGGVLFTMRSGMGVPSVGTQWDMQAIIACVIGGTSIYGGKGSIYGTIIGVVFMALVLNIMLLLNIPSSWQYVGLGGFMILGIILDVLRTRYLEKKG